MHEVHDYGHSVQLFLGLRFEIYKEHCENAKSKKNYLNLYNHFLAPSYHVNFSKVVTYITWYAYVSSTIKNRIDDSNYSIIKAAY